MTRYDATFTFPNLTSGSSAAEVSSYGNYVGSGVRLSTTTSPLFAYSVTATGTLYALTTGAQPLGPNLDFSRGPTDLEWGIMQDLPESMAGEQASDDDCVVYIRTATNFWAGLCLARTSAGQLLLAPTVYTGAKELDSTSYVEYSYAALRVYAFSGLPLAGPQ